MTLPRPRYPIYIPSKGRADRCLTARALAGDGVPFWLVVEPQEADLYAAEFGRERLLVLPFRDLGSVVPARNWIKEHATAAGYARHWQLDDNIRDVYRWWAKRIRVDFGVALRVCEDLTDRYTNVAVSGLNYVMFGTSDPKHDRGPLAVNVHVYSCSLILNATPYRWRGRYNEDTDYCLQVLADGWCTLLVLSFMVMKIATMLVKGGNTEALYQGDGRLRMARALERLWPGVVSVDRRWGRPQHVVRQSWRRFDTPLQLRPDVDLDALAPNEYGLTLRALRELPQPHLRELLADWERSHGGRSAEAAE